MSDTLTPTRRDLLATTGKVAAASALAGLALPHVHAGENNTIQVALIGCGGRGTGAAMNALASKQGPTKLVAMADVFDHKMKESFTQINRRFAKQMDVKDRQFIGFDAYKKAMDCLKAGDVAIFATPPAFRWLHFGYAIKKGLNTFMEKPVTVDGPGSVKMLKLAEEATKKKLKVGVGLMCRHCPARRELFDRIKKGQIGDLVLLRAYRMAGPTGTAATKKRPDKSKMSELMYQISNFHGFLWLSGGAFSDFLIHNIDECCWMKDAWPVEAQGSGGRHYRGDCVDQNFDSYSVEYTFADGTKLRLEGRTIPGCKHQFASYAHGTKGSAIISTNSHWPSKARIFKGHKMTRSVKPSWEFPDKSERDPYQEEWEHLMAAIRKDTPYNEAKRGTEASIVTSMGRLAAHTGQVVTYKQMLDHDHEFAPGLDELTLTSASPLKSNSDGKYPIPEPGIKTKREY